MNTLTILAIGGTIASSWVSVTVAVSRGAGKIVKAGHDLADATRTNTAAITKLSTVTEDHSKRITQLEFATRQNTRSAQ